MKHSIFFFCQKSFETFYICNSIHSIKPNFSFFSFWFTLTPTLVNMRMLQPYIHIHSQQHRCKSVALKRKISFSLTLVKSFFNEGFNTDADGHEYGRNSPRSHIHLYSIRQRYRWITVALPYGNAPLTKPTSLLSSRMQMRGTQQPFDRSHEPRNKALIHSREREPATGKESSTN